MLTEMSGMKKRVKMNKKKYGEVNMKKRRKEKQNCYQFIAQEQRSLLTWVIYKCIYMFQGQSTSVSSIMALIFPIELTKP